uniref:Oligopeptide ABC transporter, ATP-binding protein n=1 Tax=Pseudomonas syringae group genomosp. 3 TaxID=251701 RepID=A0A330JVU6_9PSED|nr:oligopeptide ABC transporter, ATP-binding protein [Pseudomonas syringae group genomosp. 3]
MQISSPVLAIDNLYLEFPGYKNNVKALNGLSLHINPGEIVGVVGESGSGKSVTAMLSMRLLPERSYRVTAGSLYMLGRDILMAPEKDLLKIRGRDASMIFQRANDCPKSDTAHRPANAGSDHPSPENKLPRSPYQGDSTVARYAHRYARTGIGELRPCVCP